MLMCGADATAADVEVVEEEEEEDESGVSGGPSELVDRVEGEGEVNGETTIGAVRVLQFVRSFRGDDAVCLVDRAACLHCPPPGRSVSLERGLPSWPGLSADASGGLQSVLVSTDLASFTAGTRGDIFIEESFG
ncbi:hypothetical protein SprV_0100166700 [Sparganum proliferum]